MASSLKNLSDYDKSKLLSGEGLKIGIVVSEWNDAITFAMRDACLTALSEQQVGLDDITVVYVPGTYELPSAAKMVIKSKAPDVVICLGTVIKGDTKHDDYINNAVANGLIQLSLVSDVPCIFGVLTTNNLEQAQDRAGGKHGNKGIEAAITAIRMANLKKDINKPSSKIGF